MYVLYKIKYNNIYYMGIYNSIYTYMCAYICVYITIHIYIFSTNSSSVFVHLTFYCIHIFPKICSCKCYFSTKASYIVGFLFKARWSFWMRFLRKATHWVVFFILTQLTKWIENQKSTYSLEDVMFKINLLMIYQNASDGSM